MLQQVHRRRLRIAQVAPLYESVPPKLYGGTERVVAYLAEELIRRGHEVTLFASGDSTASAKIQAFSATALRAAGLVPWGSSLHLPMLSEVFENAARFDVIHCHLDYWSFPFARMITTPAVTTLHGRLDIPQLFGVYRYYSDAPVISISDAQREPLPELNWVGTVQHGLPASQLRFHPGPGKYLAFLGRIAPEKRVDLAIEVAARCKVPLKIAAKVDAVDREYFESQIRPLLGTEGIEFIGEISEREKSDFLGNAIALLFPVDWPEPFGLVMIEALACGTPVIARPCGSVPEVLREAVTGFMASSVDGLVDAVQRISSVSREQCRAEFETRFTASVMAANYERIYCQLIDNRRIRTGQNGGRPASEISGGIAVSEDARPTLGDIETA
ncbi:MAG TPA: glycosyltransferase family 4 protein [Candidatus Binataceae bacterium]|nr:glycosyltransferase family 4 protein [Candidatus Binataceae bacterium]